MAKTAMPASATVPVTALKHIEYDQRRIDIGATFAPRLSDLAQLLDAQAVEPLDPLVKD